MSFKVIGGMQAVAQSIIDANYEQIKDAARAVRRQDAQRAARLIAVLLPIAAQDQRLEITTEVVDDGVSDVIEVSVGNLRRESMLQIDGDGYTGSGIDDIVKLFAMGWNWHGRGKGIWHGKVSSFRTSFHGVDFVSPVLERIRGEYPDITITAPAGWER